MGMVCSASGASVSVVIPAYQNASTIERALESVAAQTYPNIVEVIVVDDGSTDETAHILTARFPDVRYVGQENAGAGAARNRGTEMAWGDYVAFLDADDEWFPDKIATQMEVALTHPGLALVLSDVQAVPARRDQEPHGGAATRRLEPGGHGAKRVLLEHVTFPDLVLSRVEFFPGCSTWFQRRDVFLSAGALNTDMLRAQDIEYLWRLTWLGYGVGVIRTPLAVYYEDPKWRVSAKVMVAWAEAMKEMADRYVRPAGAGACHWLRADEAEALLKSRYRSTAEAFFLCGRKVEAMALLREAQALPGGDLFAGPRILMALCLPSVFFWLRGLWLRTFGH